MVDPLCIAIDWSGDRTPRGQQARIVAATVRDGRVVEVRGGRTRAEVFDALRDVNRPALVGLDFSFSVPAWFAREHACATVDDVWALVAAHGETWLRDCPRPFWGPAGTRCGIPVDARFRVCEAQLRAQGRQPKSIFQLRGAGAVATGSLRGMPGLARLRADGIAVWPFDAMGDRAVFEVYPSLYAKVATNDAEGRAGHLERFGADVLGAREREAAIATDDAFDAVVSALAMWERRVELRALESARDPITAIEGAIA
ncbi:MAG TPA: DUF429 domain-containing protein [Acidimicrobiia bacterium]|nr:DUF429 domain-containing protein [Acidimicrobiia bacterium]